MKSFVSYTAFNSKPSKPICGKITNQLKGVGEIDITSHQLAEYLCCGHTVAPVYPSKDIGEESELWYIGFDFDKMDVDMEERLKGLKDAPTIAYHTFSHGFDGNRYRFVYVFSKPIYGKDFYDYQKRLIVRNHFENVDPRSQNINRLLHGTIHPVLYSGIIYDHELKPIQLERSDTVTRKTANPPALVNHSHPYEPTADDISVLTSVGVSPDVASFYYTHSWNDYLLEYNITQTLQEESEYIQLDGESYSIAPNEYYSLPRQWRYCHEDINGKTITYTKPRKWKDGQGRGRKIYQAIISLHTLNQDATADDLLYYTVKEYCTFYNNYNSDDKTVKYNRRGLATVFADGMKADITRPRKPLKHPVVHITKEGVNRHVEAPKASAKERHKKILSLYNSDKDIESNLSYIQETLGIHLTKRTLKAVLRGASQMSKKPSEEDRIEVFKCIYDPNKTDGENLNAMQDNIPMSRATYYRLKKRLVTRSEE